MLPTESDIIHRGGGDETDWDQQEEHRRRRVGKVGSYPQRRRTMQMLANNVSKNYERIRPVGNAAMLLTLAFDKAFLTLGTHKCIGE